MKLKLNKKRDLANYSVPVCARLRVGGLSDHVCDDGGCDGLRDGAILGVASEATELDRVVDDPRGQGGGGEAALQGCRAAAVADQFLKG